MRRRAILCGALALSVLGASPAAAQMKLDPALLPLVGGDSDVGLGLGLLASLARVETGKPGFTWKLTATSITTFLPSDGSIRVPFQDYFMSLSLMNVLVPDGRLRMYAGFTHSSTLEYHGLGNASVRPNPVPADDRYDWRYATARITQRLPLGHSGFHESTVGFTHNDILILPGSQLLTDAQSHDPLIRRSATLAPHHGVALFTQAIGYDSRDNEVSPTQGSLHRFSIRVSPASNGYFSYGYVGTNAYFRGYRRLWGEKLVVAWRALGDVLFGNPPTYELGRHERGWAIGGTDGVRGVPAQRYYGQTKVLGSVEMRSRVLAFKVFGQHMELGFAAFVDAGRVFATIRARPDLDGGGLGIKYGIGGGPRLAEGKNFVARLDIAYSPDARPVGIYVGASEAF